MTSNVLIIGSGGREHALAWKLAQSPRIGKLYVAPGNGGTRDIAENVAIEADSIKDLAHFAEKNSIDLTVVGPDDPLALGVVDVFQSRGMRIFGPTRAVAQIEASKAFAKRLMRDSDIPTAPFRIFRKYKNALEYVRKYGAPIVVKASGLALGKGAYPCKTIVKAEEALAEIMLERTYKQAGNEVIVEEFLKGQEVSIHVLCDGKNSILLPTAQDHKPIFDGDRGKNTGGMGTIVPVPWVSPEILQEIDKQIVRPTLQALAKKGKPLSGITEAEKVPSVVVFHAGTMFSDQLRTSGGRVLGATAVGKTLQEALDLSYEAIQWIKFQGRQYRKDIGAKAIDVAV